MFPRTALFECLRGEADAATLTPGHEFPSKVEHPTYISEQIPLPSKDKTIHRTAKSIASDILTALLSATKPGRELGATYVLEGFKKALQSASALKGPLKEAYDRASEAVSKIEGLVKEYPYYAAAILTVVALGVLVVLTPAVIHALGFGVLGLVEGSFASAWQSTYGGVVKAGSLFSYLQKLGMLY